MRRKSIFNAEGGQALLIVVLVMVVALTVGLSVSLRSVTNLRTAIEEESSQRAFFAAEAGIEQALKASQTGVIIADRQLDADVRSNTKIKQVSVAEIEGTQIVVSGGNPVQKDDGADVWLVTHNADGSVNYTSPWNGNLTINWGVSSASECNNAALEVILLTGTQSAPTSTRHSFDRCSTRRSQNNFAPGSAGGGSGVCASFPYSLSISGVSSGLLARVVPLYANTPLCVEGSIAFPSQGRRIESVGTSGTTERKVILYQGFPKLPAELFQYVLFSPRQ